MATFLLFLRWMGDQLYSKGSVQVLLSLIVCIARMALRGGKKITPSRKNAGLRDKMHLGFLGIYTTGGPYKIG